MLVGIHVAQPNKYQHHQPISGDIASTTFSDTPICFQRVLSSRLGLCKKSPGKCHENDGKNTEKSPGFPVDFSSNKLELSFPYLVGGLEHDFYFP